MVLNTNTGYKKCHRKTKGAGLILPGPRAISGQSQSWHAKKALKDAWQLFR